LDEIGISEEREFWHKETTPLDPISGQGAPHVQYLFAGHRAVSDVDCGTGLVRLADLGVVQDVGRAVNRSAVEGQMQGGSVQGVGLALMEEIQLREGKMVNGSFTDYLIPTVLDVPMIQTRILEFPDPDAPYGIKGAGEPSTISSTPAIVASLRDATGRPLAKVPVRAEDLLDLGV
jgi:CO/xanthine dehydrogenase Mo-binding subunit